VQRRPQCVRDRLHVKILREPTAVFTARSMAWRMPAGFITVTTYSPATSLNNACKSTSCWYSLPIAVVAD
jgi:hypothetical protein